jgi:hypothetical protein
MKMPGLFSVTFPAGIRLLAFVALALAGGCRLDAVNPITPVEQAQNDEALFGVWRARDGDSVMYVHIGPKTFLAKTGDSGFGRVADAQRIDIAVIEHHPTGFTQDSYVAHVSRVGRQRFLNVEAPPQGSDPGGYYYVHYALTGKNLLRVSLIDSKVLGAMIFSGKIEGVVKDGALSEATITAGSAEILEFIERNRASLFAKPLLLKRVPGDGPKRGMRESASAR